MNINDSYLQKLIPELLEQHEAYILDQLTDLIDKGILVVENDGPFMLFQESTHARFRISKPLKFTVKDKEYIERLEKENAELKAAVEGIKHTMNQWS